MGGSCVSATATLADYSQFTLGYSSLWQLEAKFEMMIENPFQPSPFEECAAFC